MAASGVPQLARRAYGAGRSVGRVGTVDLQTNWLLSRLMTIGRGMLATFFTSTPAQRQRRARAVAANRREAAKRAVAAKQPELAAALEQDAVEAEAEAEAATNEQHRDEYGVERLQGAIEALGAGRKGSAL